jgi:hypothetical protein
MKKKFLKIAIISVLLLFVCATIVNALSFTATMTPSSTTVAESTEFTVVIKVSNLDVGSNGINALSGYLKYDKDVFEVISDSSIDGLNSWSRNYSSDSGKVTLTKTTFVKSEEEVFQVTFKTKADVSGKSGKIEFTNIVASNSESEISATDISTEISIGAVSGNFANTSSNSNSSLSITANPVTLNTTNTNTNTNVSANVNTNTNTELTSGTLSYINSTNTSPEEVPYTGVEDTIMYVIVGIVVVAIIFYIKFERINKEMK